jgi:hypothetical protein
MDPNSSFSLGTRPCLIDLGRFRWDIYDRDSLHQSSAESYATEDDALAEGKLELDRLTQTS